MCVQDAPSLRLCPFLPCTLLAPMAHRACAHLSSSPPSLPGRPVRQEADVPLGDTLQAWCVQWPSIEDSLAWVGTPSGRQPSRRAPAPQKEPHQDSEPGQPAAGLGDRLPHSGKPQTPAGSAPGWEWVGWRVALREQRGKELETTT